MANTIFSLELFSQCLISAAPDIASPSIYIDQNAVVMTHCKERIGPPVTFAGHNIMEPALTHEASCLVAGQSAVIIIHAMITTIPAVIIIELIVWPDLIIVVGNAQVDTNLRIGS